VTGDFLLELLSEEIPARMQAKAEADLARLFAEQLTAAGLAAEAIETYSTPRRLALIVRGLLLETAAVSEERKGPSASAPAQAIEGFLRSTGLTRDQLVEREDKKGVTLFAIIERPGRATADVLAEAVPAIVRAFPWPKSMRWGAASASTESLRWVRPLQGIVALLGEEIVDFEIAGVRSGAATVGHRFHHPGIITIGSANDYAEKLRACHVVIDAGERRQIIADGAAGAAEAAGLALVEDAGLTQENAGLTEWPVPLLGSFDPAFLQVPREVIQLTMRTNQKYFACTDAAGALAPNFVCTANIEAADGGAAIVAGNERVLSARLSDAKFFWEHDLKIPLEEQAKKLDQIVFHEKLGTVADKVERVAKLARWLVEQGIVTSSSPERGGGPAKPVEGPHFSAAPESGPLHHPADGPPPRSGEEQDLAALAETAARLCKADLVTSMVGEFPELQGIIGGHLARAQGHPPEVADAIRDHYKPVGQGDEVPTAPVTVAVSLADKLDTIAAFLSVDLLPSGSRDPFAIRRSLLSSIAVLIRSNLRLPIAQTIEQWVAFAYQVMTGEFKRSQAQNDEIAIRNQQLDVLFKTLLDGRFEQIRVEVTQRVRELIHESDPAGPMEWLSLLNRGLEDNWQSLKSLTSTLALDRLKVQQREAGVRHDLIDAVFALGGEDDLVRLLARVKALQSFVETPEGADLLAGYKRAANILKKEGWGATPEAGTQSVRVERSRDTPSSEAENSESEGLGVARQGPSTSLGTNGDEFNRSPQGEKPLSYTPESAEAALIAALDAAAPKAADAVAAEDFEGAMAALASLRAPVDAFFDKVIVNDPDRNKREARLALLARVRDAVHTVAAFSKIEG
jgi:glycyl-tRNA synthetase beta chain